MSVAHRINDRIALAISVPVIAILVPNMTGLIVKSRYSIPALLLQYCYFCLLVFIIWQGSVRVVIYLKKKVNLDKKTFLKYFVLTISYPSVYTAFIATVMLWIWTVGMEQNRTMWSTLLHTTILFMIVSIFITVIYENYFLYKKKLSALSKVERLTFAKTQAELAILKSQIDPHFLFNSLNTLSFLISSDADSAKLYNDTLAKVYRYILLNKQKDLVVLREEIEFISNYFYLLSIRYGDAIKMVIEINNIDAEGFLIPPISLQTLVENAIKHNSFDDANPLVISVSVSLNQIIVTNRLSPKSTIEPKSKTGLANLENRYRLITNRNISIAANQFFIVKLPVINAKS